MVISKIYSDGMILQRGKQNIIEGYGEPDAAVRLLFDGELFKIDSSPNGYFKFDLPMLEAGGPHKIILADNAETLEINDIYYGDVFLLSGQSNMELPIAACLDMYADIVPDLDYPLIRHFQLSTEYKFGEPEEVADSGNWVSANPETVLFFSALGFFFAEYKYKKDNVPIGLINASMGGTHIESFMSEEYVLKSGKKLREIAQKQHRLLKCICLENDSCKMCYDEKIKRNKDDNYIKKRIADDLANEERWLKKTNADDIGLTERWFDHEWNEDEIKSGLEINVPDSWLDNILERRIGTVWVQRTVDVPESWCDEDVQLRLGTIVDADDTYVNGELVGQTTFFYPPRRYNLKKGVLKPGKNVITVRVIVDNNVGEFKHDMPYCLKKGNEEISLEGTWNARIAAIESPKGSMMFFSWQPTALYNRMIYPIRNLCFDTVLFYQGESNTRYPEDYEYLMRIMVKEWRELFNDDLPFIFAKLPYFRGETWEIPSDDWEKLRDAQQRAVDKIDDAYIVELYDLGVYNDIHPQNKKEVAKRFFDMYLDNIFNKM